MKYMAIVVAVLMLSLAGCKARQTAGRATAHKIEVNNTEAVEPTRVSLPDGTEIHVPAGGVFSAETSEGVQPIPSDEPATAKLSTKKNPTEASSGKAGKIISSIDALQAHFILGVILIICGGILWLLKRQAVKAIAGVHPVGKLALIAEKLPAGTGLLVMSTGVMVIVLPYFLETNGWMLGLAVGALLLMLLIKFAMNMFVKNEEKENA